MTNDLLNYDLKIYQDENKFKFSIDSILLAEFVEINFSTKNIMDFCSGNAPIPMILSTKFKKNILGVELQKDIYDLGIRSIKKNNIKNINFLNMDVKDLKGYFDYKFDIVTCNPPYFKYNSNSVVNIGDYKAIARHEININLEDVVSCAANLLRYSGSLCIVHRCERFNDILEMFKKYNFGLRRLQFVYNDINSNSCFLLIEGKYNCKDDLKVLKPLFIDKYLEGK